MVDEVISPDPAAYRDDMSHVADLLEGEVDGTLLDYVAQFLGGVARSAEDMALADIAGRLKEQRKSGMHSRETLLSMTSMIRDRISQKVAI